MLYSSLHPCMLCMHARLSCASTLVPIVSLSRRRSMSGPVFGSTEPPPGAAPGATSSDDGNARTMVVRLLVCFRHSSLGFSHAARSRSLVLVLCMILRPRLSPVAPEQFHPRRWQLSSVVCSHGRLSSELLFFPRGRGPFSLCLVALSTSLLFFLSLSGCLCLSALCLHALFAA